MNGALGHPGDTLEMCHGDAFYRIGEQLEEPAALGAYVAQWPSCLQSAGHQPTSAHSVSECSPTELHLCVYKLASVTGSPCEDNEVFLH